MLEEDHFLFGHLVVRNRLATQEQVDECMEIQRRMEEQGSLVKLGDILVSKGYLTESQLQLVLRVQQKISHSAGQRIPGYEIVAKMGQGSMGSVYKARQISMDRVVAIKVLSQHYSRNKDYVERFMQEALAAARMSHPNIVRAIDTGHVRDLYFLVMEYVDGESVRQRLQRERVIPERDALEIVIQIARALSHAHKHGVIHRDIKPDNILVDRNRIAKLCDLGLARSPVRGGVATDYGVVIGTPSYMSCEQAKGGNELDARTDIYSLGATLYHMVTGVLPFEGTSVPDVVVKLLTQPLVSPADRNPRVHPHVSALILKMMSKEPSQRHRTADEVEEDLTCLLEGRPLRYTLVAEPTVASPETSTDMSRPPSRGRGVAATPSPGSLGAKAASGARDTTSRKPPSRSVRRPSHQPGVPAIAFLSGSYRGKIIPITQPVTIVGRMPECDIQVLDSWFSRRHFIVHARDQGFEVEDLQSMNGTRINGQPVQRSPLRAGDKITVHETLMQFVFLTNEESEEELP